MRTRLSPTAWKTILLAPFVPGIPACLIPCALGLAEGPRVEAGAFHLLGLVPFAAGAVLVLRCLGEFVVRGRGTHVPMDAPRQLVVSGPYRYVRNPMYVGVMLVLLGETVWFGALWVALYAICLCIAFHAFILLHEEPHLRRTFGASFEAYRHAVPRWIPRGTARSRGVNGRKDPAGA